MDSSTTVIRLIGLGIEPTQDDGAKVTVAIKGEDGKPEIFLYSGRTRVTMNTDSTGNLHVDVVVRPWNPKDPADRNAAQSRFTS